MENLLNFLRDNALVTVLTVVGIGIAVAIPLWQRKRKRLGYEMIINTSLIRVSSKVNKLGKLEVRFNDKPIENLSLYVVKFQNIGNLPILPNDYVNPLTLKLGKVEIVNYSVEAARNPEIHEELSKQIKQEQVDDGVELTFPPLLLNRSDWFTVHVMVNTRDELNPQVSARIVDVEKIEAVALNPDARKNQLRKWLGVTMAVFLTIYGLVVSGSSSAEMIVTWILMGVSLLIITFMDDVAEATAKTIKKKH